jgi:stage V sporulation protein G
MEVKIVEMQLANDSSSNTGKVKAFLTLLLNDAFIIKGFKIVEGTEKLFLAYPSRKQVFRCPQCGTSNLLGSRTKYCRFCLNVLLNTSLPPLKKYLPIVEAKTTSIHKNLEKYVFAVYKNMFSPSAIQNTDNVFELSNDGDGSPTLYE